MRRDLLITALLFTVVGFVAGYVFFRQTAGGSAQAVVRPASPPPMAQDDLPEGHPPLDVAQRWRELQERAEANPSDPAAALEFANLLYDLQRWEAAVEWYQRALALAPNHPDAHTDLATSFFHLQRYDEALAQYQKALAIEPGKPQALYGVALVRLVGQKDLAGARQVYERLQRAHPDFPGLARLARELESGSAPR